MKSNDFLKEGFVDDAARAHQDHEVQMARKDCFNAAENAVALHKLLKNVSEVQGIEGWVAAKITLAADYLNTVREYLEYELMHSAVEDQPTASMVGNKLPIAEGRVKQLAMDLEELTPQAFKKKYNKTKEEVKKELKMPEKAAPAKQGVAESAEREIDRKREFHKPAKEDLSTMSTKRLLDFVKKHEGGGVPTFGAGAKLKRVKAELKRRQQNVEEEKLEEYGDTARGQAMLAKVHHRAADRVTSKKADTNPAYARKAQQTQDRAWERLSVKEQDVEEGTEDNPALGVDQVTGKEKLRPHTGVGPKPGTLKHKLGKMAHTAKGAADFVRGKPDRMGHLEENNTGSMATVNNPKSNKPKSQIGSLFGGTYGEPTESRKKVIKR